MPVRRFACRRKQPVRQRRYTVGGSRRHISPPSGDSSGGVSSSAINRVYEFRTPGAPRRRPAAGTAAIGSGDPGGGTRVCSWPRLVERLLSASLETDSVVTSSDKTHRANPMDDSGRTQRSTWNTVESAQPLHGVGGPLAPLRRIYAQCGGS
jgi:hypothetical protein